MNEITQLRQARDRADAEFKAAQQRIIDDTVTSAYQALQDAGLSAAEAATAMARYVTTPTTKSARAKPKGIRYRCRVSGKEWSGLGRPPAWFDRNDVGGRIFTV